VQKVLLNGTPWLQSRRNESLFAGTPLQPWYGDTANWDAELACFVPERPQAVGLAKMALRRVLTCVTYLGQVR
jgi:hypothetical protein